MYEKNLTEDLRLRLSTVDMDFLRSISSERACSVSEAIRSIISEYRRSLETMKTIQAALDIAKMNGGKLSNGDTKPNIDNQL